MQIPRHSKGCRVFIAVSMGRCGFREHIWNPMPFMADVAHDECVIEGDAVIRKCYFVRKEGGLDLFHGEWAHLPVGYFKPDTVETTAIPGHGIPDASALEKGG